MTSLSFGLNDILALFSVSLYSNKDSAPAAFAIAAAAIVFLPPSYLFPLPFSSSSPHFFIITSSFPLCFFWACPLLPLQYLGHWRAKRQTHWMSGNRRPWHLPGPCTPNIFLAARETRDHCPVVEVASIHVGMTMAIGGKLCCFTPK